MNARKNEKLASHLLQEWHPTRNGLIDPTLLMAKSGKSPWWLCKKCEHEWQAPIYHRSNGTGCPKCKPKAAWEKHQMTILNSRGSLAIHYPHLILEWHPTKNGNLAPHDVSPSSGKKVWWKCPKGDDHEWEAIISNRIKGRGCPICSGRKAAPSNCLHTTHPDVAKEWHPVKNLPFSPFDVTFASHRKMWWQCLQGHEWISTVANRTRCGDGKSECPICLKSEIGQRRIKSLILRDGSLADVRPEIAKQWHPSKNNPKTPADFTAGSREKVWWQCSKGHEWYVPISARRNHGCPKCTYQTSQLELRVYCELLMIFPNLEHRKRIQGDECDIFLPLHSVAIEVDGYPWHNNRISQDQSKRDRLEKNRISLFRIRDERLPLTHKNDISYLKKESHFQIVQRLVKHIASHLPLSTEEKNKLSEYVRYGKLSNEDEFKKMLNDVWTVPEHESVARLHPWIIDTWDYEKNGLLTPSSFSAGSEMEVHWKCQKHSEHRWKSKINNRIKSKGCPFCLGKRVCSGNSLAILEPDLAAQWDYEKNTLTPSQVSRGSSRKIWWKCHCGSSWEATIWSRVNSGNAECLLCYNQHNRGKSQIRKAVLKHGSFADKCPVLAQEWHPIKNGLLAPHSLSCGSNMNVWWKCPKGEDHEWQNSIVSRIQSPTCPFCCGKKVSLTNSLHYCFPKLAKEWHLTKNDFGPKEITKCSGRKVWWQCENGHEWEASVTARRKGNGCPFCAGKKASINDNFESHYPKIAAEWHQSKNHPALPVQFRPNSNQKVWWSCSKHSEHTWQASIASRTRGTGCPFCASKQTSAFYNLTVINPALAQEWHPTKNLPLSPNNVTPNSGRKVWWQCSERHEWQANINNRARGRGCPHCKAQKLQYKYEQLHESKSETLEV